MSGKRLQKNIADENQDQIFYHDFFSNYHYPLISNFNYLGFILEFLFVLFLYFPVLGQNSAFYPLIIVNFNTFILKLTSSYLHILGSPLDKFLLFEFFPLGFQ